MRKKHLIEIIDKDRQSYHFPLKSWLRNNPEFISPKLDASKSTSHELSRALKKAGWLIRETPTEVIHVKPMKNKVIYSDQENGNTLKRLSNQIVGNIGLYYSCYHLSKCGWNVIPTARNTRGIDLIIYSQDFTRFLGVQIKTVSKRDPIGLGDKLEKIIGDYWILITNAKSDPVAYVLHPEEVRRLAHRGDKKGKVSFWLQPSSYDQDAFKEAWSRLGSP